MAPLGVAVCQLSTEQSYTAARDLSIFDRQGHSRSYFNLIRFIVGVTRQAGGAREQFIAAAAD